MTRILAFFAIVSSALWAQGQGPSSGSPINTTIVDTAPQAGDPCSNYNQKQTVLSANPPTEWVCVNTAPKVNPYGIWVQSNSGGGGGASSFPEITGGTNTNAAMVIGSGASMTATGSGQNVATSVPVAGVVGLTFTGSTGEALSYTGGTPVTGNVPIFDASHNLTDSGHTPILSQVSAPGTQWVPYLSASTNIVGGTLGVSNSASATKLASFTGTTTTDDCAKWDAFGNVIDAGSPCGSGGSLPSQTGHAAQYLTTNGTVASWGNIVTGVSGALDCVTIQGTCDVVTSVVPLKANANTFSGAQTFSGPFSTQGVTSATDGTVASASTIAPTTSLVIVTGTAAIGTITAPAGCTTSGTDCALTLLADVASGPFTLTAAGNIYATYSGTIGQAIRLVYFPSASKWYQIH